MIVNSHCRDKEYLCEISVTVRYSVLTQTWWYTLGWLQWGHSLSISNTLSINTQCCNTKFVQTKNGAMGPSPETQDVKHFGTSVRRSSRPAFGRSTGNDVSGHYKPYYHCFPLIISIFVSVATFSHRRSALIKNLVRKNWRECPKTLGSRPWQVGN